MTTTIAALSSEPHSIRVTRETTANRRSGANHIGIDEMPDTTGAPFHFGVSCVLETRTPWRLHWPAGQDPVRLHDEQRHHLPNGPRYTKPLLDKIQSGVIDPSLVITHRMPLDDAPAAYKTFRDKEDGCIKVVLKP